MSPRQIQLCFLRLLRLPLKVSFKYVPRRKNKAEDGDETLRDHIMGAHGGGVQRGGTLASVVGPPQPSPVLSLGIVSNFVIV